MGNNNTTVLHEEESSKLEDKGKSQDQVLLAEQGRDGDEREKGFAADPDSLTNGKTENGVHPLDTSDETELQTKESEEKHETAESELSEGRGAMHSDGSDVIDSVAVDDHVLQTHASVADGEAMSRVRADDESEFPELETGKVGNELVEKESGEEKNPDEKNLDHPDKENALEEVRIEEEDREVDETSKETQRASSNGDLSENNEEQCMREEGFSDQQKLENHVDDDDDDALVEPILQEINPVEKSGVEVEMIDRCVETRETGLRRMSRCRSLPVRTNMSRVLTDSLVRPIEPLVACPSSNNKCCKEEVAENVAENLHVSCVGRNNDEGAAATETDNIREAEPEMRSPSFGFDLRVEARTEEPSDRTPLLYEDKAEMYGTTMRVEEKTITMKRSESERSRKERSEAEGHHEEPDGGSGDNLRDKKSRERRRSKASLFGTCLCCATVMN